MEGQEATHMKQLPKVSGPRFARALKTTFMTTWILWLSSLESDVCLPDPSLYSTSPDTLP